MESQMPVSLDVLVKKSTLNIFEMAKMAITIIFIYILLLYYLKEFTASLLKVSRTMAIFSRSVIM